MLVHERLLDGHPRGHVVDRSVAVGIDDDQQRAVSERSDEAGVEDRRVLAIPDSVDQRLDGVARILEPQRVVDVSDAVLHEEEGVLERRVIVVGGGLDDLLRDRFEVCVVEGIQNVLVVVPACPHDPRLGPVVGVQVGRDLQIAALGLPIVDPFIVARHGFGAAHGGDDAQVGRRGPDGAVVIANGQDHVVRPLRVVSVRRERAGIGRPVAEAPLV